MSIDFIQKRTYKLALISRLKVLFSEVGVPDSHNEGHVELMRDENRLRLTAAPVQRMVFKYSTEWLLFFD